MRKIYRGYRHSHMLKLVVVIFLLIATFQCSGQKLINMSDSLPIDSSVMYGTLNNGFSYAIKRNSLPAGRVIIWMYVDVGYAKETLQEKGISHLIEHLAFRKTEHFPNGVRVGLAGAGLNQGADFVASTGDVTTYKFAVPANDTMAFKTSLRALRDIAESQQFDAKDLAEERAAVLNEMRQGAGPTGSINHYMHQLFEPNSRFPKNNDLEMANVQHFSATDLTSFCNRWYVPQNVKLIIVGDVNEADVSTQVQQMFDQATPSSSNHSSDELSSPATVIVRNQQVVVVQDLTSSTVNATFYRLTHSDGVDTPTTLRDLRSNVLDDLFSCLLENRFALLTSKATFPVNSISISMQRKTLVTAANVDGILTSFKIDNLKDFKSTVIGIETELNRIERWKFSESEIVRAKRKVAYNQSARQRNSTSLVAAIYSYLTIEKKLPADSRQQYLAELSRINAEDIGTRFGSWLTQKSHVNVVIYCPPAIIQDLPSGDSIFNWLDRTNRAALKPLPNERLRMFNSLSTKLKSKTYRKVESADTTVTELFLDNGAHVILKTIPNFQKSNYAGERGIVLHVFSSKGASRYQGVDYSMALATPEIQQTAGLGNLSNQEYGQWKQLMNEAGYLSASPYVTMNESGVRGGASKNNYEQLLNLVYLQFTQPKWDPQAIVNWVTIQRAANSRVRTTPKIFEDSVAVAKGVSVARFDETVLKQMKYSRTFHIYKELFSDPKDFTFSIVGDFSHREMTELCNLYLGSIPKSRTITDFSSNKARPISKNRTGFGNVRATFVGDSGGNVNVRIVLQCTSGGEPSRYVKLQVLNEIIRSALYDRLREKEKGVYAVYSSLKDGVEYDNTNFDIQFEAPPDRVDSLIESTIDEIEIIKNNQFDQRIFDNATAIVRARFVKNSEDVFYWLSQIHAKYTFRITRDIAMDISTLNSLKAEDIAMFAADHLQTDQYALFKLF